MTTAGSIFGFLVCVGSVSCASTTPHASRPTHTPDPSIPKCAAQASLGCLTTPLCQYDETNQCQLCVCTPAMQSNQQIQAAPFTPP